MSSFFMGICPIFDWWFIGEERSQSIDCFCQSFLTESSSRVTEVAQLPVSVCNRVATLQNAFDSLFLQ